jgi:predicted glycoside hydrolase/deacetylase ChbG (UPF0249 family)
LNVSGKNEIQMSEAKSLIVNADDFGLSNSINEAILKTFANGIVTRVSLMANGPAFENACQMVKKYNIPVGLHANFTDGVPVLPLQNLNSIVNFNGQFLSKWQFVQQYFCRQIKLIQIFNELESQIFKMLDAGIKINHIDSHHHIHSLGRINDVFQQLAQKYSINYIRKVFFPNLNVLKTGGPIAFAQHAFVNLFGKSCGRKNTLSPQPGPLIGFEFYRSKNKLFTLEKMLNNLKSGKWELFCHPIEIDRATKNVKNESECQALCDKGVGELLVLNNIDLLTV